MTEARIEARRKAGVLKKLWWACKAPYWKVLVTWNPELERRAHERVTLQESTIALNHSLTKMIDAFHHGERK